MKIGIFITCLVDVVRPNIGVATVMLLRAAGVLQYTRPAKPVAGKLPITAAIENRRQL